MMIPLVIITILFYVYISQKHFSTSEYLPARACIMTDKKNKDVVSSLDMDFMKGQYQQPELKNKKILPANTCSRRQVIKETTIQEMEESTESDAVGNL